MIYKFLPKKIKNILFGDRELYGLKVISDDKDWVKWLDFTQEFYLRTQKTGVGNIINEYGYRILKEVSFEKKIIFEIGPGNLPHRKFWNGIPDKFIAIDVDDQFLSQTEEKIPEIFTGIKVNRNDKMPLEDNSVDIILSFYSLEHMYDLDEKLIEFKRILKKDGLIIGAIPNEGGLAWGLGRYLTSRRFVKKNSNINYDKIICWEHPNFSDKIIKAFVRHNFKLNFIKMYPFNLLKILDLNLVTSFILSKH